MRPGFRPGQGWKKEPGKNRNDGNDHQQFDERKRRSSWLLHAPTAGATPLFLNQPPSEVLRWGGRVHIAHKRPSLLIRSVCQFGLNRVEGLPFLQVV